MISLEKIIDLVVREVIEELTRRGFQIEDKTSNINPSIRKINMNKYKTPLLTEANILEIDSNINEIEIPVKTIITPSAQDLIRKRKIRITKIG